MHKRGYSSAVTTLFNPRFEEHSKLLQERDGKYGQVWTWRRQYRIKVLQIKFETVRVQKRYVPEHRKVTKRSVEADAAG